MSKSKKRKGRGKPAAKGATAHAVRESLGRRLAAEALVLAEQLVASRPTPEHRELLAQAIAMRLEAMVSGRGDAELAARLVGRLEELSADSELPSRESWASRAGRFRSLLLGERLTPEADPQLLASVVDMAIRNASFRDRLSEGLAAEVDAVGRGLRAVESGDHEAGLAAVNGIGFRSPLAPWRLLIRGLTHYYDGGFEAAEEVWKRLPPERPPRRIAGVLLALESRTLGDDPPPTAAALRRLQSAVDEPSRDSVAGLRRAWVDEDSLRVVSELGRLVRSGQYAAEWLQQLCDRAWSCIAESRHPRAVAEMKRQLPPPRWDRDYKLAAALAILLDPQSNTAAKLRDAATQLEEYFAELDSYESLSPQDRAAIRSVVSLELAKFYFDFHKAASASSRRRSKRRGERAKLVELAWEFTLRLLQRTSEASPEWEAPVKLAEKIIDSSDEAPDSALVAVLRRHADAHPDQAEALRRYGGVLELTGETQEFARVVEKLERVAPRDAWVRRAGWQMRMDRVRSLAVQGDFPAAFATIRELETLRPESMPAYVLDLLAAAVEYKRKDSGAAEQCLDRARGKGIGEASLAMLMEVHATRMKLPAEVKRNFRQLRETAVKEKVPARAAELARLMTPLLVHPKNYSGAVTHRREVLKYLRRCLTVRLADWTPQDVRDFVVCHYSLDDDGKLAEAIYKKFRTSMRHQPSILFLAGFFGSVYDQRFALQRAIDESERHPEVALPEELLDLCRRRIEDDPFNFDNDSDEFDEDDDLDDFDDVGLDDLAGLQMHFTRIIDQFEIDIQKAKSPEERTRIIKASMDAMPPPVRSIMIRMMIQQLGPEAIEVLGLR
ncbi:tetratricopeptide repeat protein [Candidatus Laterigemmans baculatus]|uniref:tetratricopeptide repeat protein n=1 Tax=Candidatus Laterigemmans baculatus TaxID=2770505 RepID=UPI0013DC7C7D|nr:hypothetical protein [Candidatus Laterigemmans baculatus]